MTTKLNTASGNSARVALTITEEINPDTGKAVFAWTCGGMGGYSATREDAESDARIATGNDTCTCTYWIKNVQRGGRHYEVWDNCGAAWGTFQTRQEAYEALAKHVGDNNAFVGGLPCTICKSRDTVTEFYSDNGRPVSGVTGCNKCGAC